MGELHYSSGGCYCVAPCSIPNALSWASFLHHYHGHTSTAWQLLLLSLLPLLVHSTWAVQFNGNSVHHLLNEPETIVLFIFFFFFLSFPFLFLFFPFFFFFCSDRRVPIVCMINAPPSASQRCRFCCCFCCYLFCLFFLASTTTTG